MPTKCFHGTSETVQVRSFRFDGPNRCKKSCRALLCMLLFYAVSSSTPWGTDFPEYNPGGPPRMTLRIAKRLRCRMMLRASGDNIQQAILKTNPLLLVHLNGWTSTMAWHQHHQTIDSQFSSKSLHRRSDVVQARSFRIEHQNRRTPSCSALPFRFLCGAVSSSDPLPGNRISGI